MNPRPPATQQLLYNSIFFSRRGGGTGPNGHLLLMDYSPTPLVKYIHGFPRLGKDDAGFPVSIEGVDKSLLVGSVFGLSILLFSLTLGAVAFIILTHFLRGCVGLCCCCARRCGGRGAQLEARARTETSEPLMGGVGASGTSVDSFFSSSSSSSPTPHGSPRTGPATSDPNVTANPPPQQGQKEFKRLHVSQVVLAVAAAVVAGMCLVASQRIGTGVVHVDHNIHGLQHLVHNLTDLSEDMSTRSRMLGKSINRTEADCGAAIPDSEQQVLNEAAASAAEGAQRKCAAVSLCE